MDPSCSNAVRADCPDDHAPRADEVLNPPPPRSPFERCDATSSEADMTASLHWTAWALRYAAHALEGELALHSARGLAATLRYDGTSVDTLASWTWECVE